MLALALAAAFAGCAPSSERQLEENKAIVEQFTEVLNAADFDALDELVTEDFRRHSQATGEVQVNSREEFKELQRSFLTGMPDQRVTIQMMIAEGDKVAGLATYSGTQTGPMGEFPITGKAAESTFLSIFRFENGKIAELWVEWDNLAMLSQLGLFPPPCPTAGG
ncbi:MAG: ester cyclase [Gemmatimonadota bacterium]|nr:ester cyclase [Gemmatimonadota bacterium]MDH3368920.1 ester cyclase [Gemmatimonadota bacterium]MDH3478816.1 ester cyclase [Gemmatimonadota bacterium]MDH3571446.1 ester cyclase [Gemmatimonadota bacterium]MDH5550061.1 ester cyclase [Gemmatimonadota bacterium]